MPLPDPVSDYVVYLRKLRTAIRESKLDDLNELYRKSVGNKLGAGVSKNFVPGHGNLLGRIMIIGEAPGEQEDRERKPFVGRSGILLDRVLSKVGISRADDCYVTNVVKYRPPENRNPNDVELSASLWLLGKEVKIIRPLLIVPMGRYANMLFFHNATVGMIQGKLFSRNGWWVLPTYHPSAALHDASGETRRDFLRSFREAKRVYEDLCAGNQVHETKRLTKVR